MKDCNALNRIHAQVLCGAALIFIAGWQAKAMPLVQSGHGVPIVLPAHASPVEAFAASELARYLGQMSGVPFAITSGVNHGVNRILIGRSLAESAGLHFEAAEYGDDGFLIRTTGQGLVLAGICDRGTLYAVYAFLEQLGCRWFAPNFSFYGHAAGEYVPKLPALQVGPLDIRERPSFRWRKKYVEEGESHNVENLRQLIDWMAKARFNVFNCPIDYQHHGRTKWDNWREALIPELRKRGLLIEIGGHGYQNFLPAGRYFDQHPEWFGTQGGVRSRAPNVVFSTANEQAVSTFITNVKTYLREHPEIDIFDCWPPDGARWSDAPEDTALGTPVEREMQLLNRLARELKAEFPHVRLQFLAYQTYLDPPATHKPAAGLLMEFCPIDRSFESRLYEDAAPVNAQYFWQLERWTEGVIDPSAITLYSYITKYAWRSLPILVPHLIADEARRLESMGIGGEAAYSEPAAWATFEVDHYIMARVSWNAQLNVDREMKDYTAKRYGPAAVPVLRYLQLVEQVVPHAVGIPGTDLELAKQEQMLKRFASAEEILQDAHRAAGGDSGLVLLISKLQASQSYAENEMRLRLLDLQAAKGWRPRQYSELQKLLEERRHIVEENSATGVILNDGRLP